jgi:hypothetical protein
MPSPFRTLYLVFAILVFGTVGAVGKTQAWVCNASDPEVARFGRMTIVVDYTNSRVTHGLLGKTQTYPAHITQTTVQWVPGNSQQASLDVTSGQYTILMAGSNPGIWNCGAAQ